MKNFLSDLWQDLREKRLWPVAVLLLATLVAVPVVLSKPSEQPAAPAPATSETGNTPEPTGPKGLASVKLEQAELGDGSSLDTFDPSNPFRPPRAVLREAEKAATGSSSSGPGSGTAADSASKGSGGDTPTTGGAGGSVGGDTGSGPVDTGGDTGGGDTGGDDTTTTTRYAYVIDVTFSANGRRRTVKGMEKLDILPDASSPLLIFLGVTKEAGNAVFLIDSTLSAAGEGACKPSRSECAFLYLGPGSEHEFTNEEGNSYTLRVDEIRKVKAGTKAAASKKDKKTANAAVGQPAPARRFALPFLTDLVSVSTGGGDNSNSDRDSR